MQFGEKFCFLRHFAFYFFINKSIDTSPKTPSKMHGPTYVEDRVVWVRQVTKTPYTWWEAPKTKMVLWIKIIRPRVLWLKVTTQGVRSRSYCPDSCRWHCEADVKETGQPPFRTVPQEPDSVIYMTPSTSPMCRTILRRDGEVRLQILLQILFLTSYQILHLGRCKFALAHSNNL